jgi:hypothetical protein
MKKPPNKKSKLALTSQTIGVLSPDELTQVAGGTIQPIEQGFIMKDSIIVRTGR